MLNPIIICTLIFLLAIAAGRDALTGKIPNAVTFVGMALGLVLTFVRLGELHIKFAGMAIILLLGVLNIGKMGDIKLWMMVASFLGLVRSSILIIGACLLMLAHGFVEDRTDFRIGFSSARIRADRKMIMSLYSGKEYPFAPYVLFSAISCILIEGVVYAIRTM